MPFFVPGGGYLELTNVNRVIGSDSGDANTGNNVFLAMANAGQNNTGDRVIGIGVLAGANNVGDDLIAIGDESGGGAGNGLLQADNLIIGNRALRIAEDAARNVVVGHEIAELYDLATASDFTDNVVIGHRVMALHPAATLGTFSLSVIIGAEACLNANPTGGGLGGNVIIGRLAGRGSANAGQPQNNVIIGEQAGLRIRAAVNNVLIGRLTGEDIETGIGNTFIGTNSGGNIRDTGNNVCIGFQAGFAARFNATESVCIGAESGLSSLSDRNVIIGNRAQAGVLATTLDDNIIIGANANSSASAGSQNLADALLFEIIGGVVRRTILYAQHGDGFANVMLGHNNAGIAIGNARDLVALGADAARNIVKLVNGVKAAATNPTSGGYFYVSAGALRWVGSAGTDTLLAAA